MVSESISKMSEQTPSTSKAKMNMKFLAELHTPFIPMEPTESQEQDREGRKLGRKLWEKSLAKYRKLKIAYPSGNKYHLRSTVFRFLDLPTELRDIVYGFYLGDAENMDTDNDMRHTRQLYLSQQSPRRRPT
jgi:hypothetical protein